MTPVGVPCRYPGSHAISGNARRPEPPDPFSYAPNRISTKERISSSGPLVDAWRWRVDAGRELVLREPAQVVVRTLEMAGVADLLPIDPTDRPAL